MENDLNASDSPEESSPESPVAEVAQEKDEYSNIEYVDSPDPEEEYEDCNEEPGSPKTFDFSSRNFPDNASAMEGELDFEDEVCNDKEEILKENLDDDSQKENVEQEKPTENQNNLPEEEKEVMSNASDEDGEISEEEPLPKKEGSIEEGEDDGELTDEDDLEEGEVKDSSPTAKAQNRQVCRFFNRGQCTWGTLCRFLHLSVNDRGNYNMFAPSAKVMPPYGLSGNGPMVPRAGLRGGPDYHPPPPPPPMLPPPVPAADPTPVESAWERGLRQAKELIKKSSRRKEQEPDFEEKRLNLSLSNEDNDRESAEFDKENDFFGKPHQRRQAEPFNSRYDEADDGFDNGEREAREHWRGGRYENFEIRWTRQDMHKDRRQDKDKARNARFSAEREKSKPWRGGAPPNKWREDRLTEVQTARARADEWRDPWRRSKTPKGRRSRSRGRSHGSYSSVSSRSYSERSSRSSYSYSRSSSRSSFYSSRSPSPGKTSTKRKPSPRKENSAAVKAPNRPSPYKRKPTILRRTLSRSYSRSHSSQSATRSRSSSSRSLSRTPSASRSRSRSYSHSLSMDSVSSASSSISRSSSRSGSTKKRNPHVSVLRRDEVKPVPPKIEQPPAKAKAASSSLFEEMQRLKQYDKMRDSQKSLNASAPKKVAPVAATVAKDKKPDPVQQQPAQATPTAENVAKEPQKQTQHKQIKLTLLNKAVAPKIPNPLKKDVEVPKAKFSEKDDKTVKTGVKRPLSPTGGKLPITIPKRSTSSRRDELLKQLKAVEDAIARKRAKFS